MQKESVSYHNYNIIRAYPELLYFKIPLQGFSNIWKKDTEAIGTLLGIVSPFLPRSCDFLDMAWTPLGVFLGFTEINKYISHILREATQTRPLARKKLWSKND